MPRRPQPAADGHEQPRLGRQQGGGVLLPQAGQAAAGERRRRRGAGRLAVGRDGGGAVAGQPGAVAAEQGVQRRRRRRVLQGVEQPGGPAVQQHLPGNDGLRRVRRLPGFRERLPRRLVFALRRQGPGQQQGALDLADASPRARLVEVLLGGGVLAALEGGAGLQQRPLVAGQHLLVATHRLPYLLGPVNAPGPPEQIDEPRRPLRRPAQCAQHRLVVRQGVGPAQQHADAGPPVRRLGHGGRVGQAAGVRQGLVEQRPGAGRVGGQPAQPAEGEEAGGDEGGGVKEHARQPGGEGLAHPPQGLAHGGLGGQERRRLDDARRRPQGVQGLIHPPSSHHQPAAPARAPPPLLALRAGRHNNFRASSWHAWANSVIPRPR